MQCNSNEHFIKRCKLLFIIQSHIINVVAAESVKKVMKKNKKLEKE